MSVVLCIILEAAEEEPMVEMNRLEDLAEEASEILEDLFENLFQDISEDLADLLKAPVADLEGLLEAAAEELVEDQFNLVIDEMGDRGVSEGTERRVVMEEAPDQ